MEPKKIDFTDKDGNIDMKAYNKAIKIWLTRQVAMGLGIKPKSTSTASETVLDAERREKKKKSSQNIEEYKKSQINLQKDITKGRSIRKPK